MKEWIVFELSSCVIQWNEIQVASYRKINKSVTQNIDWKNLNFSPATSALKAMNDAEALMTCPLIW